MIEIYDMLSVFVDLTLFITTFRFLDSTLLAKMLPVPFNVLKTFVLPFIESPGVVRSIDAIFRSYEQVFYIHKVFDYPLLLRKNVVSDICSWKLF